MISANEYGPAVRPADPFRRVLTRRINALQARAIQALVLAGFVLLATHNLIVLAWLAVTMLVVVVDRWLSMKLLTRPNHRALFIATCISFAATAACFASVGLLLLETTSPARMAEGALVLCAVCLNVSMVAQGSRVATTVLVAPAAGMLILSPVIAGLSGHAMPFADTGLIGLGGIAYIVFIVRLAAKFNAESEALHRALEACGAANRAKSDFLTVMSHEIRTPLNGVLGMAQAMEGDALDPQQRERLKVIRDSGEALMDLLNDLLDLSRIEAGKLELETTAVDVEAVVQNACSAFAALAEGKGLAFELRVEPGVKGHYLGDRGRIRQIVCNLVSNAVKFTPQGQIEVRLYPTIDGLACDVSDTGVGIARDRIDTLFDKFVQADVSITREFGGSGLGLAICRELAKTMGGEVSVTSTRGKGSVFTVDLPLARVPMEAVQAQPRLAPALEATAARGLRILAAEDNPVNQLVLRTLLGQFGLDPVIVNNGVDAVDAWEAEDWDVILMDIQMPVLDGLAATRRIRAREAQRGRCVTPIIALTANTMTHQVDSYYAVGMDAVIPKPLKASELFAALAAVDQARADAAQLAGG
jgi:signal transduction histidine kinase/AmiR/NasT family two-component response regulator